MAQHKLVIAEKPSVAQSLAAVIGATVRKDGYLEGNGWRVSWCVGHLAGLADADSYDPKYAKWRYDDLPILWGDRIFEKCGIRRDEGGDGGKTLEIRGKRRLSARDGGANYQQS